MFFKHPTPNLENINLGAPITASVTGQDEGQRGEDPVPGHSAHLSELLSDQSILTAALHHPVQP